MTILKAIALTIINAFFVAIFTQIFISEWFDSFLVNTWSIFKKVFSVFLVVSFIVLFCVLMTQITMWLYDKTLKDDFEKFAERIAKYHPPTMKILRTAKTTQFFLILTGYLISFVMILTSLSVANTIANT